MVYAYEQSSEKIEVRLGSGDLTVRNYLVDSPKWVKNFFEKKSRFVDFADQVIDELRKDTDFDNLVEWKKALEVQFFLMKYITFGRTFEVKKWCQQIVETGTRNRNALGYH